MEENKKVIPCEVWSRVVGYYRPVQSWNVGKKQEFKDRVYYDGYKKANTETEGNSGHLH